MSASGQSWKQEVSVPCVRSPVTALTRRMHPLRFAGRFGSADRLLECRLCESAQGLPRASPPVGSTRCSSFFESVASTTNAVMSMGCARKARTA